MDTFLLFTKEGSHYSWWSQRVTVREADARGSKRLGFTFDVPLEDPSLVLIHRKDEGLRPFVAPLARGAAAP